MTTQAEGTTVATESAATEEVKIVPTVETAVETPVVIEPAKVEEASSELDDDGSIVYNPTGDAGLDVALEFIGNLGINSDDPAIKAAMNGDFSLVEAKMAALGDKARGWERMAQLAKDAYQRNVDKVKAATETNTKAILSVVGSQDNWTQITKWAVANATPEEKKAINEMVDAGPVQARAAAAILLDAYSKAKGTVINPANPAKNASGEAPASSNQPLSRREYSDAVSALHRKLGARMSSSPEYSALKARLIK